MSVTKRCRVIDRSLVPVQETSSEKKKKSNDNNVREYKQ